jgi:hypothetical protein
LRVLGELSTHKLLSVQLFHNPRSAQRAHEAGETHLSSWERWYWALL